MKITERSKNDLKINILPKKTMVNYVWDKKYLSQRDKRKNSHKIEINAVSLPIKINTNKSTPRHNIVKLQKIKVLLKKYILTTKKTIQTN